MTHAVELLQPYIVELNQAKRLWIAYSGGLDSTLLLNLVAELVPSKKVVALHINHGLHADANSWALTCEHECARLGIDFQGLKIKLDLAANIEANARDKRYAIFADKVGAGELLLTAHHANDQAETVLFRMMRGAGIKGLGGMPDKRSIGQGQLLRPLLKYSREQLREFALERGLNWIEDPSNQDIHLRRNFIRHRIIPELQQYWPAAVDKINQSAVAMHQADELLGRYAEDLLARCDLRPEAFGGSLSLQSFNHLDEPQRQLVLRHLLSTRNVHPDSSRLDETLRQLAEVDSESRVTDSYHQVELQVYQFRLYLLDPLTDVNHSMVLQWDANAELNIPNVGLLEASAGLAEKGSYEIRFRRGGERLRPVGRNHAQSLKNLLQEHQVPPWLRERIPLIYQGDELIAVAGLVSCIKDVSPPVFMWQRD